MFDFLTFPQENDLVQLLSRRKALRSLWSLLILSALSEKNEEPTGRVCTGFIPAQHGFHFQNSFVNSILTLPHCNLVTYGRCGGMAYTALDYYFFNRKIPTYSRVPEQQSADTSGMPAFSQGAYQLSHQLFMRQIDTMIGVWPFGRTMDFVWYTLASQQWAFEWSVQSELKKVCSFMQQNIPIPLGLIAVSDLARIGENHQVVACGYERNTKTKRITSLLLYDSNHPGQTVMLTIDYDSLCFRSSTGKIWRGFFVRNDYMPQCPPWLDN